MEPIPEQRSSNRGVKFVGITVGILVACCVLLTGVGIYYGLSHRAQVSSFIETSLPSPVPTSTPTPTPAPHILVHPPSKGVTDYFYDNFSKNYNNWSAYYSLSKVEVKDGKLFLEGFDPDSISIAYCFCQPPVDRPFANEYYLQADLATDQLTRAGYGLVFSLGNDGKFYEFIISPARQEYFLGKSVSDGWVSLYSGAAKGMHSYPQANTLSVYFNKGHIELYLNGGLLTRYEDKDPLTRGQIGLISEGIHFKLIVDDLFAYDTR